MSRNRKYEDKQKALGLKKVTLWIPVACEVEFKQVANFCVENPDYYPFMARSRSNGRFKKAV